MVVCVICFIAGVLIGLAMDMEPLVMSYIFTCVYGGWSIVNMFFSNIFISLNLQSIIFYYGVKILLSVVVGVFATPIFLGYCVYKIIREIMKR